MRQFEVLVTSRAAWISSFSMTSTPRPRLAGSAAYGNEAYAIDDWALAVQFHPELTAAMHETWLTSSDAEVRAEGLDPDALRQERAQHSDAMQRASSAMFSEWLSALPGAAADPRRTP